MNKITWNNAIVFSPEGIFVRSFTYSKNIHLVPSTGKSFAVDTIEYKNESDMCPILNKLIF